MAKILLDYLFPISVITPTPAASTAFLKQACIVVKPNAESAGLVGTIHECATMGAVSELTDNTNAQAMFNAGMSKVFLLLTDSLDLSASIVAGIGEFWTLLISDDFLSNEVPLAPGQITAFTGMKINTDVKGPTSADYSMQLIAGGTAGAEVVSVLNKKITVQIASGVTTAAQLATALNNSAAAGALIVTPITPNAPSTVQTAGAETFFTAGAGLAIGTFDGVVGYASDDLTMLQTFAAREQHCGFYRSASNTGANMFYAFGKMLSNQSNWTNQQYIAMPLDDEIGTLGEANSLFDDRISFVLTDTEFGSRLALFVAGGKAIAAPYIAKNLRIDVQSRSLQWISANQPSFTLVNASLLEARLQDDVIDRKYIQTKWITDGKIEISLIQDNFVANGFIDIAEPKALWRIFGEMRATL